MFTQIMRKNRLAAIVIGAAVIVLILVAGLPSTVYHQGWEVKDEIVAIDHEGKVITEFETPHTGSSGFYDPRLHPKDVMGASLWEFDLDDPLYGLPDVQIQTSDVRIKEGVWPYADLEKVFPEGYKYVVTYREYLFDVQVRTIADTHMYATGWATGNRWEHETSMPYSWHSFGGTWEEGRTGKPFEGSVYVRFAVLPWGVFDYGPAPDNYTFTDYWAGIMNVKLESKDMGKVETQGNYVDQENHAGYVRGLPSDGGQLNMFADDGTFAAGYGAVPWDVNKILDPDIHSAVIVQLPFQIMAGAYEDYGALEYAGTGAINNLYPVDYYFTATLRVETFIVKELTAREPIVPPNPNPITPPKDFYPAYIPSWLEQNWMWLLIGIIIVFVVLVVFVGPWLGVGLGWLLGIFRYADPYYVHTGGDHG